MKWKNGFHLSKEKIYYNKEKNNWRNNGIYLINKKSYKRRRNKGKYCLVIPFFFLQTGYSFILI